MSQPNSNRSIINKLAYQEPILDDIAKERDRQDRKWGPQHHVTNERWGLILGEEFGEACEAALMEVDSELRKELVQVAAVAVNWIESIDSRNAT